ncbi:MAG: transcriptional regulator FtsR [Thermoleophilia bacterium]
MGADGPGEVVGTGSADTVAGSRDDRLLTIGQVVEVLAAEFPDLSISKVRYLEDRGLLSPERTPGGYRKYNQTGVRALRTILTLQRDEFMPLDVIKERLQRGTASVVSRALAPSGSFDRPGGIQRDESSHTWAEALEITGVSDTFLRLLAEFHLFEGRGPTGEPVFTDTELEVVRICDVLAKHGVEPRNLRVLRSSAEREAAQLAQVAAPLLRSTNDERRQEGERLLADLGSLMARLLDLLLYKELARLIG